MTFSITLAELKAANACKERYKVLAKNLGGIRKYGKDTPITIEQILDSNGLGDALWALYRVNEKGAKDLYIRFAIGEAGIVLPIYEARFPDDNRPCLAIDAAREWLSNPTNENADAAAYAAARAAYAAADVADSAYAAYAAYAAAYAAYAAADAAANAADDAAGNTDEFKAAQIERFRELLNDNRYSTGGRR